MQALEVRERDEVEWGEVLHAAYSGLTASRRLLWDESERKIIALLSSSSAFEGDHFLQVNLLPLIVSEVELEPTRVTDAKLMCFMTNQWCWSGIRSAPSFIYITRT